jgi:valyl-tRNA synthetase
VFVHPDDARFAPLVGQRVRVPGAEAFGRADPWVPIVADPGADPEKGTGAVMCCTFGDTADVDWWYTHALPLRIAIDTQGCMTELAGDFAHLPVREARQRIVAALDAQDLLLARHPIEQSVRVHERCDTPVEYVVNKQWFVRVLDFKDELLEAGAQVHWHPPHMETRYQEWVAHLNWDWCISRQRYYGVTFPVWYCDACGEVLLADEEDLPVDPTTQAPPRPCACGSMAFTPETDVMDTWATSSLSPQIVGQWLDNPPPTTAGAPTMAGALYAKVFPFSLRPQAHEIIRTWAFYTIVKSHHHFDTQPWRDAGISGWGLAPEGAGKISKSRGGGPMPPMAMLSLYSADAVRYWAASTGLGKDSVISEEKIQAGAKLVTKLWNVARFSQRFIDAGATIDPDALSPADRWILARVQHLIRRATALFREYDYAAAKQETEVFFWNDLADNYLEMAKLRLYGEHADGDAGAKGALRYALLTTLKLFAPFLPHVTEEIYRELFAEAEGCESIHRSPWPKPDPRFEDAEAASFGETLVAVATAVRRYKSEQNLSLGAKLPRLCLATSRPRLAAQLRAAVPDITSVTRAEQITVVSNLDDGLEVVLAEGPVQVAL